MRLSYTSSSSESFTEARAKYVMGKVYDDFHHMLYRGFSSLKAGTLEKWWNDLSFIISRNALEKFEIQFKSEEGEAWAVTYHVVADGSIHVDSASGGINYYRVPHDVSISIVLTHDPNDDTVEEYLSEKGWNSGATYLSLDESSHGAYSKNGFGFGRNTKGDWS
ncbi:MAG: hypothetical protein AAFP89_25865 [Bacteroidota bacterium]